MAQKEEHIALAVRHLRRDWAIHVELFGFRRSIGGKYRNGIHCSLEFSAHKEWLHCQGKR